MRRALTWKQIVIHALKELGGEAPLSDIAGKVRENPSRPQTRTWEATVRRVLREYKVFEPFRTLKGKAAYRLVELPQNRLSKDLSRSDPHGEQQGMLLQLGLICGYETFTNSTDKTQREIEGVSIARFATVRNDLTSLKGLPISSIRNIDVMWMVEDAEGLYPRYAFEVEETTKVKNGLLRLLRVPARFQTSLFVVGKGKDEAALFDRYVRVSPFREHRARLFFRYYENVISFYEQAKAFAQSRNDFGVDLNQSSSHSAAAAQQV